MHLDQNKKAEKLKWWKSSSLLKDCSLGFCLRVTTIYVKHFRKIPEATFVVIYYQMKWYKQLFTILVNEHRFLRSEMLMLAEALGS